MIKFAIKQDHFDHVYIRADVQQIPYIFIGVIVLPGHNKYLISDGTGEMIELYEGEISFERDEALRLSYVNEQ